MLKFKKSPLLSRVQDREEQQTRARSISVCQERDLLNSGYSPSTPHTLLPLFPSPPSIFLKPPQHLECVGSHPCVCSKLWKQSQRGPHGQVALQSQPGFWGCLASNGRCPQKYGAQIIINSDTREKIIKERKKEKGRVLVVIKLFLSLTQKKKKKKDLIRSSSIWF